MDHAFDLTEQSTLTEWEWVGLQQVWNLADGHSHFSLESSGKSPIADMARTFRSINRRSQDDYEAHFVEAFFGMSQQSIPVLRPLLHYSCSTTIDLVAKTLKASGVNRVGVLTPTFDNIAQLTQRAGLRLRPIPEAELCPANSQHPSWLNDCDAIFLVLPNNPTGWEPTQQQIEALFVLVAAHSKPLVIDFSFRFYSTFYRWDQYALASSMPRLEWIFIEDTGKTWPLSEMKVGMASTSARFHQTMFEVTGELLLNVSPFILEVLTQTIQTDTRSRHPGAPSETLLARRVVAENRTQLRSCIRPLPIDVLSPESAISVEWLRFTHRPGIDAITGLLADGLAVLPGAPFFWNDRSLGAQNFRVALARDTAYFRDAIRVLARHMR